MVLVGDAEPPNLVREPTRIAFGREGWETLVAPLVESQWEIRSGSWNDILSDVTLVQIYPLYYSGRHQVVGIDNIVLVPEPSIFALLGIAVVPCLLRFRKPR